MKKRKKKKVLTEEEKIERQKKLRDRTFQRKIKTVFENAGFKYLKSVGKEFSIGGRKVELDSLFLYENIILVCEDTGMTKNFKEHIRNKHEAFSAIKDNRKDFFGWLRTNFIDFTSDIEKYDEEKYILCFLYFSQNEIQLTAEEKKMYPLIKFVEMPTLNYLHKISQCVKLSSKYEIFKFLGLEKNKIGDTTNEASRKVLRAPIIYPKETTGLKNGVRIVSFMMSAESLLSMSYVMRKDNWEESILLYQRLIDINKIKKIRSFIAEKGQAFYNNIIVALPDNISFCDNSDNKVSIDKIGNFESCKLEIPDEMNSICVIDGQHRIYAHYEGDSKDKYEEKIKPLRRQLHLLVTGLIFPKTMKETDRIKIQSEIFLDINSNAKPVQPDVLLHIEMLKNPLCDVGIARQVIENLNKKSSFLNMFEFSTLDIGKIKIASIIKFALRYLVTITPQEDKVSFYNYWDGDKEKLIKGDMNEYKNYIEFCAKNLEIYFSSLKNNYKSMWKTRDSKLLSVTSINGFIIAYNRQLKQNGIKDFEFYNNCLKKLKLDFSNESFKYTSSQYRKFSDEILNDAFNINSETN